MSCSVTERVTDSRAIAPNKSKGKAAGGCRLRGGTSTTAPNSRSGGGGGGGVIGTPSSSSSTAATATQPPLNGPSSNQQDAPPPLRPKPCCLLWCCCCKCPCSNPANKAADENGPTRNSNNSDTVNCNGDPPPSMEEIRSWGSSFDQLMRSPAGREVFRDFLRGEYSEENILFWLACEGLKAESNPEKVEETARIIYDDYISILSQREVSLDAHVREIVNRNMVEPTPHTFDEAQLQIYTLMHRDSYPRFVNSPLYKSMVQHPTGEAAAPSAPPAASSDRDQDG